MNVWMVIWKYEFLNLLRSRSLIAGLTLVLMAGVFSIQYGKHVIAQQEAVIDTVSRAFELRQQSFFDRLAKQDSIQAAQMAQAKEAGRLAQYRSGYSLAYGGASETIIWHPSSLSPLAIGQKDQYPLYHELSPHSDLYKEVPVVIRSPQTVQVGNFDLSFVFVYLFPLLIIAMGYNILSAERENGTLVLLSVQGDRNRVLLSKLVFRIAVVLALGFVLNLLAFMMLGIASGSHLSTMLSWLLASALYTLFWFSLVFLVVRMDWSGAASALVLGAFWVLFLLLVPAYVQERIENPHVKEQVQQLFNRRGDFPRAFELPTPVLLDSFLRLDHPYPLPAVLSDADTAALSDIQIKSAMSQELQTRFTNSLGHQVVSARGTEYRATQSWDWINPAYVAQHMFNRIAGTELGDYHNYLQALEALQTERRYYVYGYLDGERYDDRDFHAQPKFTLKNGRITVAHVFVQMFPMVLLMIAMILALSIKGSDRKDGE